ncbi:RagB/SusD family nutrient uptake outer membrane protein [Olivibacter sitiensis]|uniref:RagB/SusD family nutrient uptake outer membrane protein n=1 Tax=Olivibacter sitiensis TaxID=376470 RepID=UPI000480C038|nr:RagB/SusD family nutrient uptake outer membrane protein [Olivibacter sitiensis]
MKKIVKYAYLMGLCILTASCVKDKDPIGLLTADQVNENPSVATLQSAVNSIYQPLANTTGFLGDGSWDRGLYIRPNFVIEDIAAGDMNKKWASDGDQAWMDEIGRFTFTTENPGFNGIWTYDFEGISRANLAIDKLADPAVLQQAGIEQNLANRFLGEAYFLRAFYYFELVVNFGDLPLLIVPLESFNDAYNVSNRVDKEEIWNQIRSDLELATQLLPDSKLSSTEQAWRASRGAAIAMQAKVALYNKQWQLALEKIQLLESKNFYTLNENYFDSFNNAKEFQDQEVVFAYNHTQGALPRNGNGLGALLGWGFLAPSDDFIASFEANDPRLDYTVNVSERLVYKLMGDLSAANRGNGDSPANKILIRWADVLLWKAEALMETEQYPSAIALINQIRARARNTVTYDNSQVPNGTLPARSEQVTDKNIVKTWLMQERRAELGFEGHRFSDLRRWEVADQVLPAMGKNFRPNHYLYPIPQREIDLSGGLLTQNDGY